MKRVEFVIRVVAELPDHVEEEEGLTVQGYEMAVVRPPSGEHLPARFVSETCRRLREVGSPVTAEYADEKEPCCDGVGYCREHNPGGRLA